jgi:hypothetical protein
VGRSSLTFVKEPEGYFPPLVAVFALTRELIISPPEEWVEPLTAVEVFVDDDRLEPGETLHEVSLLWLGEPAPGTIAYRVSFSYTAADAKGSAWTWQALDVVTVDSPVQLLSDDDTDPDSKGSAGAEGGAGEDESFAQVQERSNDGGLGSSDEVSAEEARKARFTALGLPPPGTYECRMWGPRPTR